MKKLLLFLSITAALAASELSKRGESCALCVDFAPSATEENNSAPR